MKISIDKIYRNENNILTQLKVQKLKHNKTYEANNLSRELPSNDKNDDREQVVLFRIIINVYKTWVIPVTVLQ